MGWPGHGSVNGEAGGTRRRQSRYGRTQSRIFGLVAAEIKDNGGEVVAISTDISQESQCQNLVNKVVEAFGRVDGLVNSAYLHGEWATTDVADTSSWSDLYEVNCLGALRMAQACLPSMKEQGGGAIVNVSTMATVNPFPGEAAYAASKGAMLAMTRHMAKDFGQFGIRVNATRMGWIGGKPVYDYIDRQVEAGFDRDAVVGEITGRIPLGIIPPEEDCALAVLFFISDYARVVSGGTLDVNGGQYMAP